LRGAARSNSGPVVGSRVSAILLAAGLSGRFGSPKQLAELEGAALVNRALDTLERSPVDEIIVVVGHSAPEVARIIAGAKAKVVVNREYRSGLASSIRAGLAAVSQESGAAIICLADQPLISPRLLARIVSRWRLTKAGIVVSSSQGQISPPVLFSRRLFHELEELRGDRGAKSVVERHPGFESVQVRSGALLDVDTEKELVQARAALRRRVVSKPARVRGDEGP
jgi:molybdenum cofactor cytidylyltransferase